VHARIVVLCNVLALGTHWQHIGNTSATSSQHISNTLETHWKHIRNTLATSSHARKHPRARQHIRKRTTAVTKETYTARTHTHCTRSRSHTHTHTHTHTQVVVQIAQAQGLQIHRRSPGLFCLCNSSLLPL
jgi:hypothetical protein